MTDDGSARRRGNFGRGLGRGLHALFGEDAALGPVQGGADGAAGQAPRVLPTEALVGNPYQPRRRFDDDELNSLAESIRAQGVLQPILVRPTPGASHLYQIIAGERRWRAAQRAQLHEVPVVVRELTDSDALQIAIIENIQRQDLTPLEEAEGYRRLIGEFGHTQDTMARAVGKSRSHVANMLRLLELPDGIKVLVQDGTLTSGHARALLGCPDPGGAAQMVVERGLNVRQTEALVRDWAAPDGAKAPSRRSSARAAKAEKDPDTRQLETEISSLLGLRVSIDAADKQSGALTIHYTSLDQLDVVLHRLSYGPPSV